MPPPDQWRQDVTLTASWETSDASVLAIDGPGRLLAVSSGEADVRATYRGVELTQYFRVFSGEPPWPAFRTGDAVIFVGRVRDAGLPASANGLQAALVEVVGGRNAGHTATTTAGGSYNLVPPLVCGPIVVRASKTGYETATASWVFCKDVIPDLVLSRRSE